MKKFTLLRTMNCTEIFQDAKKNVFVEKSIIGNTFILY